MKFPVIVPGLYRHYARNQIYRVIDIALHTETNEKLVLYESVIRENSSSDLQILRRNLFVRPIDMFNGTVEHHGNIVDRFKHTSDVIIDSKYWYDSDIFKLIPYSSLITAYNEEMGLKHNTLQIWVESHTKCDEQLIKFLQRFGINCKII